MDFTSLVKLSGGVIVSSTFSPTGPPVGRAQPTYSSSLIFPPSIGRPGGRFDPAVRELPDKKGLIGMNMGAQ
jgi:hypothetical protein